MTPNVPEVAVTPTANVNTVKIARKLFSLSKFERLTAEKEIILKVVSPDSGLNGILEASGNDEAQAVKTFMVGFRRVQIAEAKRSIMTDDLVSPKIVSGFVNQFRPMFPMDPKKVDAKGDPTPEARKEQNQKIYAFIRANDALLAAIKAIAAATVDVDEDEDGSEDTSDNEA